MTSERASTPKQQYGPQEGALSVLVSEDMEVVVNRVQNWVFQKENVDRNKKNGNFLFLFL